jgi:hypothetical protein
MKRNAQVFTTKKTESPSNKTLALTKNYQKTQLNQKINYIQGYQLIQKKAPK